LVTALGDEAREAMKSSAFGWERPLERRSTLEAHLEGARNDGMCNICELLINVVRAYRQRYWQD